jgi:DnaJ-class molecular chaperone
VDNKLISVAVERIIRTFESMFGGRSARGGRRSAQFKGQDFNAEFHLDLKEVYTHKRTLTVNGKIFDLLFLQE